MISIPWFKGVLIIFLKASKKEHRYYACWIGASLGLGSELLPATPTQCLSLHDCVYLTRVTARRGIESASLVQRNPFQDPVRQHWLPDGNLGVTIRFIDAIRNIAPPDPNCGILRTHLPYWYSSGAKSPRMHQNLNLLPFTSGLRESQGETPGRQYLLGRVWLQEARAKKTLPFPLCLQAVRDDPRVFRSQEVPLCQHNWVMLMMDSPPALCSCRGELQDPPCHVDVFICGFGVTRPAKVDGWAHEWDV